MDRSYVKKSIALVTLIALGACAGGGGSVNGSVIPSQLRGRDVRAASLLTNIVGVGDSLTAGYQSDGILGATNFENPLDPRHVVHPTQENGWWTLLVEQALSSGSGSSLGDVIDTMFDPSKSPLPLVTGPGLDNQVVFTASGSAEPFGQFKGSDPCKYDDGFNQSGFGLRASARVRMNPNSTTVHNFGIPGLTLHEANTIHQPQTDTCSPLPGIPGLLSDVVSEESGTYWPVLRNFTRLDGNLTEVNAAASVHPTLATVWLGANDVLKYMGSGGRFVGGDRSAGQAETDLRATISTLQRAGAKVVVANLPNILETGYFQRVTLPLAVRSGNLPTRACKIRSYAYCILVGLGGLPQSAVNYYARKYHLATPNGCVPASTTAPCGYLTLAGALAIVQVFLATQQYVDLDCTVPAPSCKVVPGSGLGANYITPEFAGKVQALNNAVNQGIDDAASASHVPLVDIHTIYHGIASGNPANPYFHLAWSIAPGLCCTLGFLYPLPGYITPLPGGILSLDGIHPSNTGYGLVAYAFIDTINKAYGTSIPQIDLKAVYSGSRCSNKRYCYPDPYATHG
jgi:lysophospholipase L1-like esterase